MMNLKPNISNISVPIQWTNDTWSDWYLETVNKLLHNMENLAHMVSSTEWNVYTFTLSNVIFLSFIYKLLHLLVCSPTTKTFVLCMVWIFEFIDLLAYQDQKKSPVANFNRTSPMENHFLKVFPAGEFISYNKPMFWVENIYLCIIMY